MESHWDSAQNGRNIGSRGEATDELKRKGKRPRSIDIQGFSFLWTEWTITTSGRTISETLSEYFKKIR